MKIILGLPLRPSCLDVALSLLKAEPGSPETTSSNCGNSSLRWFPGFFHFYVDQIDAGLEAAGGEETLREVLLREYQPHLH